jgi:transcription elongation factor GreA
VAHWEAKVEKDVILTPEGYEKLQKELETLTTVSRREVADRIREAREFGDISENSEYDDAKNEQAMLEAQIAKLEEQLRAARVIEAGDAPRDTVSLGSRVTVEDGKGKKATYMIVGSAEADPLAKPARISNESPVGRALLGRKKGEKLDVAVPQGTLTLKVASISAP